MDTVNHLARLRGLPKTHLHVHLEGSARPDTIREFAAGAGVTPPNLWSFRDLAGLVGRYRALTSLIRTPEDLARLIEEFVEDEAIDGVVYTEPMFSPVLYTHRFRWSLEQTFSFMHKEFQKAAARYRIEVRYMIGANWARPIEAIERLARFAAECADFGVVSFGFSGEEPAGDLERYERACAIARTAGLVIVPHLGETGGPVNVRAALDLLGAQRIAHGIGAAQDRELLRYLVDRAVVCDVCPSSNLRLGIVPSLHQHPVRAMLQSGVAVTINADDPLFFRTSVSEEIAHVRAAFSLSDTEVTHLVCAGLDAAGASVATRSKIRTAATPLKPLHFAQERPCDDSLDRRKHRCDSSRTRHQRR